MSEPKRWLIECDGQNYTMNGYADELSAVRSWAVLVGKMTSEYVRVSEVLPGHKVTLSVRIEADYQ